MPVRHNSLKLPLRIPISVLAAHRLRQLMLDIVDQKSLTPRLCHQRPSLYDRIPMNRYSSRRRVVRMAVGWSAASRDERVVFAKITLAENFRNQGNRLRTAGMKNNPPGVRVRRAFPERLSSGIPRLAWGRSHGFAPPTRPAAVGYSSAACATSQASSAAAISFLTSP